MSYIDGFLFMNIRPYFLKIPQLNKHFYLQFYPSVLPPPSIYPFIILPLRPFYVPPTSHIFHPNFYSYVPPTSKSFYFSIQNFTPTSLPFKFSSNFCSYVPPMSQSFFLRPSYVLTIFFIFINLPLRPSSIQI
jgi:hypothetical protein